MIDWPKRVFTTRLIAFVFFAGSSNYAEGEPPSLLKNSITNSGLICHRVPLPKIITSPIPKVDLIFSTEEQKVDQILGERWQLPLLDSCALQISERRFWVYMPDGTRHSYLFESSSEKNGDKKNEVIIDEDKLVVRPGNGVCAIYRRGRILSFEKNDFTAFWQYAMDGRLKRIHDKDGTTLLSVAESTSGADQTITLEGDLGKLEFQKAAPRIEKNQYLRDRDLIPQVGHFKTKVLPGLCFG